MPAHPRLLRCLSDALPPLFGAMGPAGIRGRYVGIVVVEKVLRSKSVSISEMTSGGWVNCDYSPLSTPPLPPLTTISIHLHRIKKTKGEADIAKRTKKKRRVSQAYLFLRQSDESQHKGHPGQRPLGIEKLVPAAELNGPCTSLCLPTWIDVLEIP